MPGTSPAMPPIPAAPTEPLWTIDDVRAYLRVSRATIYRLIGSSDALPSLRMGSLLRFDPGTVRAWACRPRTAGKVLQLRRG